VAARPAVTASRMQRAVGLPTPAAQERNPQMHSKLFHAAARALATAAAVVLLALPAAAQTKLLRYPDIHGDRVVFSYGSDIWTASASGGLATRITAHPGQELFPKFSPDGKWIAFTGQYDGDEQVYIVPAEGGVPKRLTWYPARGPGAPRHGVDHQVYGWTPDGTKVLFRSMRDSESAKVETGLYTVPVSGGLPAKLPMFTAGAGDFSPDGSKLVYSPLFRDFRTWKRYEGGWAQDLYVYDLATGASNVIAPSRRTERDPMWIGDRIFFVSDRDGTLNLYSVRPDGSELEQLTRSTKWDVRWASSDKTGRVVYELGGELRVWDVNAKAEKAISITVPTDGLASRPSRISAERNIEGFGLSPKGERAVFVARGDVFTVPIEKGPTRNLTRSSNAHEKHASWSPDGKTIAYVSDRSGEEQIWIVPQDGSGPAEMITSTFAGMLSAPAWSPDGTRFAVSDKDGKLYVVTIAGKRVVEVADDAFGGIFDYAWSPDSGYIAFSMGEHTGVRVLHVWSAADGRVRRVTSEMFSSYAPAWDPEGKVLWFLSDREFAPQISNIEWNYAGNRRTGIFAMALRKDVASPFAPESDEVTSGDAKKDDAKDGDKGAAAKKDAPKPKPTPVVIDWDGLSARVVRVPVESDNINRLEATKDALLYVKSGANFYGRQSYTKPSLTIYDLKKREESELVGDVRGWAVSQDGSKVLVRLEKGFSLYDAKPKAKDAKSVSTKELMVDSIPAEEWATIFDEVWRRYRDFFYVRNMHGYDWKALGDQYRQLLPHVSHRSDLTYVLSEMVSELNVGHAYVEEGDIHRPQRPKAGLPGARFELDAEVGRYRIAKIFRGHNEEAKYRSPLTAVGVDARVGDWVMAIDGEELRGDDNPYRLLQHKTHPVTLTLNTRPSLDGARKVTYEPIENEAALLYLDWVLGNQEKVTQMSGGRVGYLHIPDMGAPGIYEFLKWFYPQIRKEGLVVDVRSNGGGNVSQWIIERLNRTLLGTRFGFSSEHPATYPYSVFHGHMAALINETSASDGDIFPARFKKAGLGPLIGKRTWGGVVGISGRGPLLDGGNVFVPQQATNDVDGAYIIEGEGVAPDIEVENDPLSVAAGRDPQLERAVEEILAAIERDPKRLPTKPPDPVKTK
jgi:tricorn protease